MDEIWYHPLHLDWFLDANGFQWLSGYSLDRHPRVSAFSNAPSHKNKCSVMNLEVKKWMTFLSALSQTFKCIFTDSW